MEILCNTVYSLAYEVLMLSDFEKYNTQNQLFLNSDISYAKRYYYFEEEHEPGSQGATLYIGFISHACLYMDT